MAGPKVKRVVVCGGGNAAHVAVGMYTARGAQVDLFMSYADEAERMKAALNENGTEKGGITVDYEHCTEIANTVMTGKPWKVSKNPADVIPGACMVLIISPADSHEAILKEIAPHITPGVIIVAMPGPGGFNMLTTNVMQLAGHGPGDYTVAGIAALPWVCRIEDWGHKVHLAGTKKVVDVAALPSAETERVVEIMNSLHIDTVFRRSTNFLHVTLFPTNCIIHPGVTYGLWHDWDGTPVEKAPLFYQGLSPETGILLDGLSNDIQNTAKAIEEAFHTKISVPRLDDYMVEVYSQNIADKSSTQKIFSTNEQFQGLLAPVLPAEGGKGVVPRFNYRYLTEDLPHGVCVIRGIAEILGVETPFFDKVILWGQKQIGHSYIVDGKMCGRDVEHSGCPQRFGITTIEQLKASVA